MIPSFRFFDVDSGHDVGAGICDLCRRQGLCSKSEDENSEVCLACLASGHNTKMCMNKFSVEDIPGRFKFGNLVVDTPGTQAAVDSLMASIPELRFSTPRVSFWQEFRWPIIAGTFARFEGMATRERIVHLTKCDENEVGKCFIDWLSVGGDPEPEAWIEHLPVRNDEAYDADEFFPIFSSLNGKRRLAFWSGA